MIYCFVGEGSRWARRVQSMRARQLRQLKQSVAHFHTELNFVGAFNLESDNSKTQRVRRAQNCIERVERKWNFNVNWNRFRLIFHAIVASVPHCNFVRRAVQSQASEEIEKKAIAAYLNQESNTNQFVRSNVINHTMQCRALKCDKHDKRKSLFPLNHWGFRRF